MKYLVTILICGLSNFMMTAQTNIFPASGNVGIGTTTPDAKLKVVKGGTIGGYWNPSNSYFTLSNGATQSMIMDSNEIYGSSTLVVGSRSGDIIKFRNASETGAIDRFIIKNNGYVGIGTNSPVSNLHISQSSGDAILRLEADTDNNHEYDNPLIQFRQDGDIIGANVGFNENFGENRFGIGTWHSTQGGSSWDTFVMDISTGNIGIGTNNISSEWKLAVKGKIRAEEIKVETGWADYVFKEDYNLPTLEEVEKHIQEKGHLINIPSAKEVEENGIQLGEMNKLLLEKIEELTLYILKQEKRIQLLENNQKSNK